MHIVVLSHPVDSGFSISSVSPLIAVVLFIAKEWVSWWHERRAARRVLAVCAKQLAKELTKPNPTVGEGSYGRMLDAACRAGQDSCTLDLVCAIGDAHEFIGKRNFDRDARRQMVDALKKVYERFCKRSGIKDGSPFPICVASAGVRDGVVAAGEG